ncbi:MAG: DUF4160 domain-containing protein [Clostridiales Family XIII bacterium]|jgi:hypothetical protein|nr:DUF4160 domain-containing protein [Clostridiales Family XIII bacterium]
MPELSRFYGIVIRIFFSDNERHHKPHIHAYYSEHKATIGIDGELLAGSIPVKQLKLIQAWLVLHEDELYVAWGRAIRDEAVDKIEPLK